ncbi:MAG: hypothetical protein HDR22_07660 [Lachnospiraceae bacterium]|nr:hypothetical protein [Lachnospiraceae bacterium]
MENKRLKKISVVAVVISLLPLATFIPTLLNIALPDEMRSVWAGINILSVLIGFILSVVCVKNHDSRSAVNIIGAIISSLWILLICGILALAVFINFIQ